MRPDRKDHAHAECVLGWQGGFLPQHQATNRLVHAIHHGAAEGAFNVSGQRELMQACSILPHLSPLPCLLTMQDAQENGTW